MAALGLMLQTHAVAQRQSLGRASRVVDPEKKFRALWEDGVALALGHPVGHPELNPDELLNHDLKLGLAKRRPRNRGELKRAVRSHLHKR